MQRNFALQLRGQSLFIAWAGGVVTEDFLGGDHWIFRMTEKVISHKLSLNLRGGGWVTECHMSIWHSSQKVTVHVVSNHRLLSSTAEFCTCLKTECSRPLQWKFARTLQYITYITEWDVSRRKHYLCILFLKLNYNIYIVHMGAALAEFSRRFAGQ